VREEPKFIRLRLWRNGLEAYPTNVFQREQHRPILGPMAAPSIQDNHVARGAYVCALPHNKLFFGLKRLWDNLRTEPLALRMDVSHIALNHHNYSEQDDYSQQAENYHSPSSHKVTPHQPAMRHTRSGHPSLRHSLSDGT
jgi:hypothetical protein